MKRATVLLFSLLFSLQLHAGIKGIIQDEDGKPIPFATVVLLDAGGRQMLKTSLTDKEGKFQIEGEIPEDAQLLVTQLGYEKKTITALPQTAEGNLGIITMNANTHLKEVNVTAQKPLIEIKGGKVVMNVQSSISAEGSNILEMLQRAPNVSVDHNDNISLKGRQGVQIMMDGKLLQLQGTELANMLKSIPAATLDKIEIMSNPGAQYDAAGTAGIINLTTKREKRSGYNGSATLGWGHGVYPKGNAGLNLNYRNSKWNTFMNLNASQRKGFNKLDVERNFLNEGNYNGHYQQNNYARLHAQNYSGSVGADYQLSSKTILGIGLNANSYAYTFGGENNGRRFDASRKYQSYFVSNNMQDNANVNYGLNINMRHKLDTSGQELNVDADYARYTIDNNQVQTTHFYLPDGSEEKPTYVMQGAMPGDMKIYAVKADYKQPLSKTAQWETGAKVSSVTSDNQPVFYDASNGGLVYDASKSNHFIYEENILAAYTHLNKEWKKFSVQAGLRYEHTLASGVQMSGNQSFERNYGSFFPNVVGNYTASPQHNWSVGLSRRISRPNYHQLNPFKNYIDPTSIHQGNPYLQPSYSYNADVTHLFKNKFSTSLSYSKTMDVITQVIVLDEYDPNITLVTDRNLAVNDVWSLSGYYPIPITKWWNSMNNMSIYYSRFTGNISNTPLRDGLPTAYVSSNNTFSLPNNWSAEMNAWFISDQRYGYMYLRPMYAINLGVQKQLWNKTATVRLSASDIFRTQNPTGLTELSNYREHFIVTRDTRTINLTFTYRFGNSKWQRARHEGGAEEERRRAGGGGQTA